MTDTHRRSGIVVVGVAVAGALLTITTASALLGHDGERAPNDVAAVDQDARRTEVAPGIVAPTHFDAEVSALQTQLAEATNPSVIASLQEKLRIAETSQREEREANAAPADPGANQRKLDALATELAGHTPGVGQIPGTPAAGGMIVEGAQPPVPAAQFYHRDSNAWGATLDGVPITVWAGSVGGDIPQGAVLVTEQYPPRAVDLYPTPIRAGELRIVDVEGDQVQLVSTDGTSFTFDISERAYITP